MKKIGVIGCGARARHVMKLFASLGQAQISVDCCYDPDPAQVDLFCAETGLAPRREKSYEAVTDQRGLDWVLIFSPNHAHAEQMQRAWRKGKHVFCEKPLGISYEQLQALRGAYSAVRHSLHVGIGFTLRYSPHYRAIQALVASGRLGEIISVEFNETLSMDHGGYIHGDWRRRTELAGPHILEKCSHDIDMLSWILGQPLYRAASFSGNDFFIPENAGLVQHFGAAPSGRPAFSAWKRHVDADPFTADKDICDNQVIILEFDRGTRASFHTNCASAFPERRLNLYGTLGTLRSDVITGLIEFKELGYGKETERLDAGVQGNHGGGDDIMVRELQAAILHGSPMSASFDDAWIAASACLAIEEADAGEGVIIATLLDGYEVEDNDERLGWRFSDELADEEPAADGEEDEEDEEDDDPLQPQATWQPVPPRRR